MPSNVVFSQQAPGTFNVKNFGAVGDGSTDDTAAITAAIQAAYKYKQLAVTPAAPTGTSNTGASTGTVGTTISGTFAASDSVQVALTYWTGRGETMVGPTTTFTVAAANNQIVVNIPTFPAGVVGVNVYLSQSNGSTTLLRADWPRGGANVAGNNPVQATSQSSGGTYTIQGYPMNGTGGNGGTFSFDEVPQYNATGGGNVYFPAGVYITQSQQLYPNVHLYGDGMGATVVRLKPTAAAPTNYDLFNGGATNIGYISIYAAITTGKNGRLYNWSINDMTLDGNKGNVSGTSFTSYCLRVYGYNYQLSRLNVLNGYSGGILGDWNGYDYSWPGSMEAYFTHVKVHDCGGAGITWAGPHDSMWSNVVVYDSASHCVYVGPHANGLQATNVHFWRPGIGTSPPSVGLFMDTDNNGAGGSHYFYNAEVEGADSVNVVNLCNTTIFHGSIYGGGWSGAPAISAVQVGAAYNDTPYAMANPSYIQAGVVNTKPGNSTGNIAPYGQSYDIRVTNCTSSNGVFWVKGEWQQNRLRAIVWGGNGKAYSGTPAAYDDIDIINGAGGSFGASMRVFPGIVCMSTSGLQTLGGTSATITNGGTTIKRVTASASGYNGIIMAAGLYSGQILYLINEGANSFSFATQATSNVADGTNVTINAYRGAMMVWDSGTSLWYHCSSN